MTATFTDTIDHAVLQTGRVDVLGPGLDLTARGFEIEEDQREKLRVSACLSKPFSPREVLATIEEVLKQDAVA